MKITELKPTKRDGRVNVYIDGEYSFTVYEEFIYEYSLFPENEFNASVLDEILLKDNKKFAKIKAFDTLSRGAVTVSAMRKKLTEKGVLREVTEETVDYLVKNDYLNDYRFAENAVSVLHETKGFGKNRVMQFFYEKGVFSSLEKGIVFSKGMLYNITIKGIYKRGKKSKESYLF
jgi:regulatory protein